MPKCTGRAMLLISNLMPSIMLEEMDKADDIVTSLPLTSQIPQLKTESLSDPVRDVSPPCEKPFITTCLVSDTDGKTEDNSFGINNRFFFTY